MASRQAQWQQRKRAEGRCAVCGEAQFTSGYCQKHYEQRQRRYKGREGTKKSCSVCGEVGHNKRTCPQRKRAEAIEGTTTIEAEAESEQ